MAKKKATVKITGVRKARDNALKFLQEQQRNANILNQVGAIAAAQIRQRTQAGLDEYKQDPITESTKISREIFAEVNSTSPFAQKKSNLTYTGQLLNSIKHKVVAAQSSVFLFLTDYRSKLKVPKKEDVKRVADSKAKNKRGRYYAIYNIIKKKPPETTTNNQVKSDLEAKGRKFFFLSQKIITRLESEIASALRKSLTLYNRVKRKL